MQYLVVKFYPVVKSAIRGHEDVNSAMRRQGM
jgi:hypothetical protein